MVALLESVTEVTVAAEVDNTALNLSSPSFQYKTAEFPADPRWMYIPESMSPPEDDLLSSNNGSSIVMFVVSTDVVVPLTCKLPFTITSAVAPSIVSAVVSEPPSLMLNLISPSDV